MKIEGIGRQLNREGIGLLRGFNNEYGGSSCYCRTLPADIQAGAGCSFCAHPGNPENLKDNPSVWKNDPAAYQPPKEMYATNPYQETGKPTNPKDAVGINKPPSSTLPQNVMAEVGVAMLEGALKYGRHNYRVLGVRASVYYDATCRHIDSWWEGEDIDPDSKLSHITKAISSLVVIRDAMMNGKMTDDRPPKSDVAGDRARLTELVKDLLDRYPEPKEAYINIHGDSEL